jgi:hypothetical protein
MAKPPDEAGVDPSAAGRAACPIRIRKNPASGIIQSLYGRAKPISLPSRLCGSAGEFLKTQSQVLLVMPDRFSKFFKRAGTLRFQKLRICRRRIEDPRSHFFSGNIWVEQF